MRHPIHLALPLLIAGTLAAYGADGDKTAAPLPGVQAEGHGLVKPLPPEPEPADLPPARRDGWDVRISGSLTVDVGSGRLFRPRN